MTVFAAFTDGSHGPALQVLTDLAVLYAALAVVWVTWSFIATLARDLRASNRGYDDSEMREFAAAHRVTSELPLRPSQEYRNV